VWDRLHELLLAALCAADRIDWSRAVVDSSHVRALKRGAAVGPSPVDRARPGSKHHLLTDATGTPLAVKLTGGNAREHRADIHEAFLKLACCPICWRRLQPASRSCANVAVRPSPHTFQA
jgi:hypothetical protein